MTAPQCWAAIAAGKPCELTAEEATRMINVLRRSVLDGLPVGDAAQLARRILACVQGGPELYAP